MSKVLLQAKLAIAFSGRLADAVHNITYFAVDGTEHSSRAAKTEPKFSEIDGEFVKSTSSKFIILTNEIDVKPAIDGEIVCGDETFNISLSDPDEFGATWEVFGET